MSFSRWIYLMVSLGLLGLDPTAMMMMGLRHVLNTTIIYQKMALTCDILHYAFTNFDNSPTSHLPYSHTHRA